MSRLRVYHAFRSPYSRLGVHVIERAGLDAEVIAFTGPPDGVPFGDPLANKPKLRYYNMDVPRMTMRMGLPIAMPNPFAVDFTPANKALTAAARDGKGLAFACAVSDARWGEGKNVSDMDVLKTCAEQAGWSAAGVEAAQTDPAVDETLEAQRKLIKEDGVFGVPFAVMGDSKYWGHDRFALLVEEAGA